MNPQIVDIFNFGKKTLADTNSWKILHFILAQNLSPTIISTIPFCKFKKISYLCTPI